MSESTSPKPAATKPKRVVQGEKLRGAEKVARVPVKFAPTEPGERLRKPKWIRAKFPGTPEVIELKKVLRENSLVTVCEEASCPNIGECFGKGTATFMIMGDICTRRCPFCDVAHGRPNALDTSEPANLARTKPALRCDHVGGSRRSARRWRRTFCRLHQGCTRCTAVNPD